LSKITLNQYLDEDFDIHTVAHQRAEDTVRFRRQNRARRGEHAVADEIASHSGDVGQTGGAFNPTFTSSRHEREWILNYLGPFYDNKLLIDVLRKVKGGKEANVYCCVAHPDTGLDILAAKVYRPRLFRNLRNDAQYRQGRPILNGRGQEVRDRRALLAVHLGTRIGKEMEHTSWLAYEYQTLQMLHAAGGDVPRPLSMGLNTILMEYVGDPLVPAPALNEVTLPHAAARPMFERLLWNVELMLAHGRIHGDLSAYNVLYWAGNFKIIDFPQAIDPASNPDAAGILRRDVTRLCQYFARYGIEADPAAIAADLWARYGPPEESLLDSLPDEEEDS
jgi:RIO kinase 1